MNFETFLRNRCLFTSRTKVQMDEKVSNEKKGHGQRCFCCCIGGSDEESKFHQKTVHEKLSDDMSSDVRSNIDHPIRTGNDPPHSHKSDEQRSGENISPGKSSSDTIVHNKNPKTPKNSQDESPDQGDAAAKDKDESNEEILERRASSEAVRRNTLINSGRRDSVGLLSGSRPSSSSPKSDQKSPDSETNDEVLEDIDIKNKVKIEENNKKDTVLLRKKRGFFHRLFRGFSAESQSGSEVEEAKDVLHLSKKKKDGTSDSAHSDGNETKGSEVGSNDEGVNSESPSGDEGSKGKVNSNRNKEEIPNPGLILPAGN